MAFKLNAPYKINPISIHEVAFSPDNVQNPETEGLVAKANDNGTIIMNKNIDKNSELYSNAKSHEGRHVRDMMDNKLAYDEDYVYENIDGKGAKAHSRDSFSESDKTLKWEAPAYNDGDNKVEHDLRPKPNKLSGPPSMKDETPIAFKVMGSRHETGRSPDKEKVSMNEQFAMYSPIKKWSGPSAEENKINEQSGASGNDADVTKPDLGIRQFVGGNDYITQQNDFERRTQEYNLTPEGKRLGDSVNAMSRAMNSGDFKEGSDMFFANSSGENTYFTEEDLTNATGRYAMGKNNSVGQQSLLDRGESGGAQSSYMDSDVFRNVVSMNKDGNTKEVANLNDQKEFADYPTFGDDDYYKGIDNKKAAEAAKEKANATTQSEISKRMSTTSDLQKQLRNNPDLSARYNNVASMKRSDVRKKEFQKLLDLQIKANQSQDKKVTKPSSPDK